MQTETSHCNEILRIQTNSTRKSPWKFPLKTLETSPDAVFSTSFSQNRHRIKQEFYPSFSRKSSRKFPNLEKKKKESEALVQK